MSYFMYKDDKPRKYRGFTIRPNKKEGNWSVQVNNVETMYSTSLASIKRGLKRRKKRK
jgi:hypothetical protein